MKRRENGSGSIIFDTARKNYRAYITVDGQRIGRRFKTRQSAADWITQTRAEILQGSFVSPSELTIGDWAVEYLKTYSAPNVRPSTMQRYLETAKFLAPISSIPLQKINALEVQRFYNELPEMSGSSRQKIHSLLCRIFKKALALDLVQKNPMLAVERPRYEQKEVQIFTTEEIKKLLQSVQQSKYYKRYFPLIYFAVTTGCRLSEILGLRADCVHKGHVMIKAALEHDRETTAPPKTKAGIRKITISKTTEALLRKQGTKGFVFTNTRGKPFSIHNFERAWRHILAEAEVDYKNFHCIRHTHATRLLAVGVPVLEVAKRLGHSRASHTLSLYGHSIPGFDALIPDKVDQAIFGHNLGTVGY